MHKGATRRIVSSGAATVSESLGSFTTGGSVTASSTSENVDDCELNILEYKMNLSDVIV